MYCDKTICIKIVFGALIKVWFIQPASALKFRAARISWEWYNISDVAHACDELHHALKTESKSSMRA